MSSTNILSVDEIYKNAKDFSKAHKNDKKENAESQTFLNEFFAVFGLDRKIVAEFERNPGSNESKRMDLFWRKNMLIEMKSFGEDLFDAMDQALDYYKKLKLDDIPRYILACDFQNWFLLDKKENTEHHFNLSELADNLGLFGFITGRPKRTPPAPVNIQASEMLGRIFDSLKASGYTSHHLEYFLTRLVFCLFADDTGIFGDYGKFQSFIKEQTSKDGSDLGVYLMNLFQVLNQHADDRSKLLDPKTRSFPYIDGELFAKQIQFPVFNAEMRQLLIDAGQYDWSKVSPAIFGNMFQTVMDQDARRDMGAHYTSEENILKVIRALFLDELNEEFDKINEIKDDSKKDRFIQFQDKLANLKFLDPACGSGNFLVISYREIRRIEHRVIMKIHGNEGKRTDTDELSKVDVDQFYGIELIEFSARIAETALWMMDHIMNLELSKRYGLAFRRIPIKKHPHIEWRDALEVDWNDILPASECSYILGNPPFGGSKFQSEEQRKQIQDLANIAKSKGTLDYVCGWYLKAGQYVNEKTSIGFVSTNSITQGEQVAQLWPILVAKYGLNLNFAYQQFKWKSEAKGTAGVTVVILGLSKNNKKEKKLFHNDEDQTIENPIYISPYLIGSNEPIPLVKKSSKPINGLSKMITGTQVIDDNNYIFTDIQKEEFLAKEPDAESLFRPFIGAQEFLHGTQRWLLNVSDADPKKLRSLPETNKRIDLVKLFRSQRDRVATKRLAEFPMDYQIKQIPDKPFLVIPEHSSEKLEYIPIAYEEPPTIPTHKVRFIPNASIELFGLLTSKMHMIWNNVIGGKLEIRNIYSIGMVYNTFPTPNTKLDNLKQYAEKILNIRESYRPTLTLFDLYNGNTMPTDLKKAHLSLDGAVEKLYRKKPFESDYERIKFLLTKYKEIIGTL